MWVTDWLNCSGKIFFLDDSLHSIQWRVVASNSVYVLSKTCITVVSPGSRNPSNFCLRNMKSGKKNRLWNPESWAWHPETGQGIRSPTSDWNPESKFHYKGRSPVPGIWNPLRGIQSPRLSWIPKGALTWDDWWISSYLQINLSCKKTRVILLGILLRFAPRLY